MAIRVATQGATQLQLPAGITKPANFLTGRSIGGADGQIMGYWQAFMVRLPNSGWQTGNFRRFLLGGAVYGATPGLITEATTGTSVGVNGVWLGQDNTESANLSGAALRLRPRVLWRGNDQLLGYAWPYAAASINETDFTNLTQLTTGAAWLMLSGVTNTAAQGDTPVWRGWAANCLIGPDGVVSSDITSTGPQNNTWLEATTGSVLMRQVFLAQASGGSIALNSIVGTEIEHIALCQGDFPWNTATDRPHHDAIAALAGVTGATPLNYAGLVAAQNAGSLPYANCRQGKGDLTHHWPLADLTPAGLTSTGSATPATFEQVNYNSLSNGLAAEATLAPLHWQGGAPAITAPAVKFQGGRGTLPFTIGGTYQAGTTALERRWEVEATGNAVPGFDWEAVDVIGSGTWQTTDTLPIGGPYTLRVRDSADTGRAVAMTGMLVGTVMLAHGQSGMAQALRTGDNVLGIAVDAGAIGVYLTASNDAGGASYVKPVPVTYAMNGGATPPIASHGSILLLNEWNAHNPGHPLLIANMAIGGRSMDEWTADSAWGQWTFLGNVGEPGVAGPDGVGHTGHFAWMMRGYTDCHAIMWTPGMSSVQATRNAYAAAIDARFDASPNAPWLVMPPWRGHRSAPENSATVGKRAQHVDFVAERGVRGILGPYWPDIVMDGNPQPADTTAQGSLHSAYHSDASAGGGGSPVSDQNQVGQGRLGRGIGRALAWAFDRTVKAIGPRVVGAWFRDAGRTVIEVEIGRAVRTLNGAAISEQFWVSSDGGTNFIKTGFTVALDATGARAVLTSTGGAWPETTTRVDYARAWPFGPADGDLDETLTERKLDGLLYDDQVYRGGVNLATPAGNPLASANGNGVAVTARGAAKLLATERWAGTRNVTVRMMAADGVTVLAEKTLAVTGS
ncbi:hypothetical protein [Sandarakinorhabdus sp.]|uniref:hypothetical protein n=1 Tax=Sandarakinorhabdus sp. TaxID=1916663 RepID=UPI003F6F23B9